MAYADSSDAFQVVFKDTNPVNSLDPYLPGVSGRAVQAGTGALLEFAPIVDTPDLADFAGAVGYSPLDELFTVSFAQGFNNLNVAYLSPTGERVMGPFQVSQLPADGAFGFGPKLAARLAGDERH